MHIKRTRQRKTAMCKIINMSASGNLCSTIARLAQHANKNLQSAPTAIGQH
jgi:hypothetical protein